MKTAKPYPNLISLQDNWLRGIRAACSPMAAGFEAEFIGSARFVLKEDSIRPELVQEADKIDVFSKDEAFPRAFREAWPKIYFVQRTPPYAYLMEKFDRSDGWLSAAEALYHAHPARRSSRRLGRQGVEAAITVLASGYCANLQHGLQIDPFTEYVGRIAERMADASRFDVHLSSRRLIANGVCYEPWNNYLNSMSLNASWISSLGPRFSGPVHGDPNLTNIFLRDTPNGPDVKMIDPKPRRYGDYLFDIAKIAHFIDVTGPVETLKDAIHVDYRLEDEGLFIDYSFTRPKFVQALLARCWASAASLAAHLGDENWEPRYQLAVAANLLGLPSLRLQRGNEDRLQVSLILYCEGMKWLHSFCNRLDRKK